MRYIREAYEVRDVTEAQLNRIAKGAGYTTPLKLEGPQQENAVVEVRSKRGQYLGTFSDSGVFDFSEANDLVIGRLEAAIQRRVK